MFRTVPLSIIRSFSLYTQQCYMSYRFADSLRARKLSANLYDIHHYCVCSEKLLMMDRRTVRNMQSFIPKINLRNQCIQLVLLQGYIRTRHSVSVTQSLMTVLTSVSTYNINFMNNFQRKSTSIKCIISVQVQSVLLNSMQPARIVVRRRQQRLQNIQRRQLDD